MARFTATVVLPTPPLPLATATRFFTPGMGWRSGCCCGAGGIFLFPLDSKRDASRQNRAMKKYSAYRGYGSHGVQEALFALGSMRPARRDLVWPNGDGEHGTVSHW